VNFELPTFLTSKETNINFKFVKNPKTLEFLKKSSTNRELFKIMMASMRTHKKKPVGFFKESLISYHNQIVDDIANYINNGIKESFLAFQEFKDVFLMNEEEESPWNEYGTPVTTAFPSFSEVTKKEVKNVEAPLESLKKLKSKAVSTAAENIALILYDICPIHIGVMKLIEDIQEKEKIKIIICQVGNVFRNMDTIEESSKHIFTETDNVTQLVILKYPTYKNLIDILKGKSMNIKLIASPEKMYNDFCFQTGKKPEHFDPTENLDTEKVINSLKADLYNDFRKLTPDKMHNYYHKLRDDLRK